MTSMQRIWSSAGYLTSKFAKRSVGVTGQLVGNQLFDHLKTAYRTADHSGTMVVFVLNQAVKATMSRKQHTNKEHSKGELHPRNKHRGRYDFEKLISCYPDLKQFVTLNRYGTQSIDFSDPLAVKALNSALLKQLYAIDHWDIPEGYLCPPIPGRADYIHHLADLLASDQQGVIPKGKKIHGLDIGVGANAVYPIIGCREYGWSFIGSDIDPVSVATAQIIAASNGGLNKQFKCRLQDSEESIFKGIVQPDECFDFTVCNPPFHASAAEANVGTLRKLRNLEAAKGQSLSQRARVQQGKARLNFGGQEGELWCKGGEAAFIRRMIEQSVDFSHQCYWFSTLVSKQENLPAVYRALKSVKATRVETVKMAQGQKISRFVAWSFLSTAEQENWRAERWGIAG